MNTIRGIKLRWLHETLGDVTHQLARFQFTQLRWYRWHPAINVFQCETAVRICVDLAGVDRSQIDLTVEPRRVAIRGTREAPEPTDAEGRAVQMIAFEIDYGPFERVDRATFASRASTNCKPSSATDFSGSSCPLNNERTTLQCLARRRSTLPPRSAAPCRLAELSRNPCRQFPNARDSSRARLCRFSGHDHAARSTSSARPRSSCSMRRCRRTKVIGLLDAARRKQGRAGSGGSLRGRHGGDRAQIIAPGG